MFIRDQATCMYQVLARHFDREDKTRCHFTSFCVASRCPTTFVVTSKSRHNTQALLQQKGTTITSCAA